MVLVSGQLESSATWQLLLSFVSASASLDIFHPLSFAAILVVIIPYPHCYLYQPVSSWILRSNSHLKLYLDHPQTVSYPYCMAQSPSPPLFFAPSLPGFSYFYTIVLLFVFFQDNFQICRMAFVQAICKMDYFFLQTIWYFSWTFETFSKSVSHFLKLIVCHFSETCFYLKTKSKKEKQQLPYCRLEISLSLASEMVLAAITLNRDFPILAANMRFLV